MALPPPPRRHARMSFTHDVSFGSAAADPDDVEDPLGPLPPCADNIRIRTGIQLDSFDTSDARRDDLPARHHNDIVRRGDAIGRVFKGTHSRTTEHILSIGNVAGCSGSGVAFDALCDKLRRVSSDRAEAKDSKRTFKE
eukprot:1566101-Pleurochrysis_carterae.AAC.1